MKYLCLYTSLFIIVFPLPIEKRLLSTISIFSCKYTGGQAPLAPHNLPLFLNDHFDYFKIIAFPNLYTVWFMRYILTWAGNTDNGVPGKPEHLWYIPIVPNNVYAKFGSAMAKIVEAFEE